MEKEGKKSRSSLESRQEEIRRLAENYYQKRIAAHEPGDAQSDWALAEKAVRRKIFFREFLIPCGVVLILVLAVLLTKTFKAHQVQRTQDQQKKMAYESLSAAADRLLSPFISLCEVAEKGHLVEALQGWDNNGKNQSGQNRFWMENNGVKLKEPEFVSFLCGLNDKEKAGDAAAKQEILETQSAVREGFKNLTAVEEQYRSFLAPGDVDFIDQLSKNGFLMDVLHEAQQPDGTLYRIKGFKFFSEYCRDPVKFNVELVEYEDVIDIVQILDFRSEKIADSIQS